MEVRKVAAHARPSSASQVSAGKDQLSRPLRPSSARLPGRPQSRPTSASTSKPTRVGRGPDDDADELNDSSCQILEDISEPSSPRVDAYCDTPSHVHFDETAKSSEGEISGLSSFGMWQGKKFSIRGVVTGDVSQWSSPVTRPNSALARGIFRASNAEEPGASSKTRLASSRQSLIRDKKDRSRIIQTIHAQNVKTAMHIVASSVEGLLPPFVPRLRPRPMSAGARMMGEDKGDLASRQREWSRGHLQTGLLTALNLPSQSDEELDLSHCTPVMRADLGLQQGLALWAAAAETGDAGPLFCDESFPADERSLMGALEQGGDGAAGPGVDLRGMVQAWRRPQELVPAGRTAAVFDMPLRAPPPSVLQGGLGNCHVLGALSVLGTRPDLLHNLFGGPARTEPAWAQGESAVATDLQRGLAVVRLYKDGAWRDVTVDTRLPSRARRQEGGEEPAFGACVDGALFWVSLLEKAYVRHPATSGCLPRQPVEGTCQSASWIGPPTASWLGPSQAPMPQAPESPTPERV